MTEAAESYTFFEHTADVGIRAQAPTRAALFVQMARGLAWLIAEDSVLAPREERAVTLAAENVEQLLLVWLQELLLWFSTERFLPAEYALEIVSSTTLQGQVRGDIFDPTRHVQGREVKAITRHQLRVRQADDAWEAEAIVDI